MLGCFFGQTLHFFYNQILLVRILVLPELLIVYMVQFQTNLLQFIQQEVLLTVDRLLHLGLRLPFPLSFVHHDSDAWL